MITNEDRYALLERKLMEAESALFGCRQILRHIIVADERGMEETDRDGAGGPTDDTGTASGLYPGQISPPELRDEHLEEECVE